MLNELIRRRNLSESKFAEIQRELDASAGRIQGKACVYATGSYGRQEASEYSDLDLFIVGLNNGKSDKNGIEGSNLRELDAICVKADLIGATKTCKIKPFDGDGRYLSHFSIQKLSRTLGKPEDDVENTFTARLLLLLESTSLLEAGVYGQAIDDVIAAYWRDYPDHKNDFVPAFLTNDILRLWRTLCINYEARTMREPEPKKAEGKLKNYKLKHGRILTCYSAIIYLLAIYGRNTNVSPDDAKNMVSLTPTGRLEWLLAQEDLSASHEPVRMLLSQYNQFLINTNYDEGELIEKFKNKTESGAFLQDAKKFGETMFQALTVVGNNSHLHRLIVV